MKESGVSYADILKRKNAAHITKKSDETEPTKDQTLSVDNRQPKNASNFSQPPTVEELIQRQTNKHKEILREIEEKQKTKEIDARKHFQVETRNIPVTDKSNNQIPKETGKKREISDDETQPGKKQQKMGSPAKMRTNSLSTELPPPGATPMSDEALTKPSDNDSQHEQLTCVEKQTRQNCDLQDNLQMDMEDPPPRMPPPETIRKHPPPKVQHHQRIPSIGTNSYMPRSREGSRDRGWKN